jgi:hypothetical protein
MAIACLFGRFVAYLEALAVELCRRDGPRSRSRPGTRARLSGVAAAWDKTYAVGMRKHSMQGLANATLPLFTASATVPPIPEATPFIMGEPFGLFGFTVALVGLVIPMIFYIVWIVVGVAVLIYLRRMLKSS